jgi:probable rRNA maturation factor
MKIEIINLQKKPLPLSKASLKNTVKKIVSLINDPFCFSEISVVFLGRDRMHILNLNFNQAGYATDVLAFDYTTGYADVVICIDIARENALKYKSTIKREVLLYLIHGLLHLAGYADKRPGSKIIMEKEQSRILRAICKEDAA